MESHMPSRRTAAQTGGPQDLDGALDVRPWEGLLQSTTMDSSYIHRQHRRRRRCQRPAEARRRKSRPRVARVPRRARPGACQRRRPAGQRLILAAPWQLWPGRPPDGGCSWATSRPCSTRAAPPRVRFVQRPRAAPARAAPPRAAPPRAVRAARACSSVQCPRSGRDPADGGPSRLAVRCGRRYAATRRSRSPHPRVPGAAAACGRLRSRPTRDDPCWATRARLAPAMPPLAGADGSAQRPQEAPLTPQWPTEGRPQRRRRRPRPLPSPCRQPTLAGSSVASAPGAAGQQHPAAPARGAADAAVAHGGSPAAQVAPCLPAPSRHTPPEAPNGGPSRRAGGAPGSVRSPTQRPRRP